MAKITKAERELLTAINVARFGALYTADLAPATRAMAKRLRHRGLLSKKDRACVRLTQAGRTAIR